METFLILNGYELAAANPEIVAVIQAVAAGEIVEDDLVLWICSQLVVS